MLLANQIPGRIAQLQGFRGTVCNVREAEALRRLLSGENSEAYELVAARQNALVDAMVPAIKSLHWKDFETLVDLVFRQAGWRRRSVLGETMKFADLELEEPITRKAYQVQIKSRAGVPELQAYIAQFASSEFAQLYFVVHSPSDELEEFTPPANVDLVLPRRLAEMVVDHGLTRWLADKIR